MLDQHHEFQGGIGSDEKDKEDGKERATMSLVCCFTLVVQIDAVPKVVELLQKVAN